MSDVHGMSLPFFWIDAFTDRVFSGRSPPGVVNSGANCAAIASASPVAPSLTCAAKSPLKRRTSVYGISIKPARNCHRSRRL